MARIMTRAEERAAYQRRLAEERKRKKQDELAAGSKKRFKAALDHATQSDGSVVLTPSMPDFPGTPLRPYQMKTAPPPIFTPEERRLILSSLPPNGAAFKLFSDKVKP